MVSLIIDNSYCKITGLDVKQFNTLKKHMSYTLPYNHFSPMMKRTVSLMDKAGNFPTGLLPYFIRSGIKARVTDKRVKPTSKSLLNPPKFDFIPDKEQLAAATAARVHHRGIISAVTGYGKSAIIGLILYSLQVRTLIVVPSIELKTQLTLSMASWFGEDKVGKGKAIWIENVQALDPKKPITGYDAVIIDEFHHSAAKTYRKLNKSAWGSIYYRFGLTATAYRSDENEKLLLESVLSNKIYDISYKTGVKNKRVVPVEAYYLEVPKQKVEGYTWNEVYNELVVHNSVRNGLINQLMFSLGLNRKSTLCLVKEVAHGKQLSCLNFLHGQDEESRGLLHMFNDSQFSLLTATQAICGEGVDTKPAEYIIIAGLGKSKNQFMQAVGRGLRVYGQKESCKVIIFKDSSHKYTKSHFKAQCKILLDEYGVVPVKIEV